MLHDPIIVMLTYFRHGHMWIPPAVHNPPCVPEVPVSLLCFAYGYIDEDLICRMVAHTAHFSPEVIRSLMYVTLQHTSCIRTIARFTNVL